MNADQFKCARKLLRMSQAALANELGWTSVKQVSNIENAVRPVQRQTELAIERLLINHNMLSEYLKTVS